MSDVANRSASPAEQLYQVRNVAGILGSLLLVAAGPIGSIYAFSVSKSSADAGLITVGLLVLSVLALVRFLAIKDGIAFNMHEGVMSYPGGGVALNGLADVVNPKFLFQYFRRFSIRMEEIRSMSTSRKSNVAKNGNVTRTYYLEVNGTFGASKISFGSNESKRDEAYSFIRQHNRMGSPIIFG
jgi:hypothetical protein